jgi:GTP-binding protein
VDLTAGLKDDTRQRPWQQIQMLRSELEAYQRGLSDKLALVIANKSDEAHTSRAARALKRRINLPVATVSAFKESDFTDLKERLLRLADRGRMDDQHGLDDAVAAVS